LKTARVYPFSGNGGSWRKAAVPAMLFSTRLACITHRIGVCSSLSSASAPQRRDPRAQRQQYPYCRKWGGDRRYRFPCHGLCWPLIWPRSKPNQSVGSSDPFEAGRIVCAEMALCEFDQDILHSFAGVG
jgi:hypothetical protein